MGWGIVWVIVLVIVMIIEIKGKRKLLWKDVIRMDRKMGSL